MHGLPGVFVAGPGITGTVLANNGHNGFQTGLSTDPASLIFADLTGKGVADLLSGNDGGALLWPNNGSLDFSSSPITIGPGNPPFMVADMEGAATQILLRRSKSSTRTAHIKLLL